MNTGIYSFLWALGASLAVSLISLIGVLALLLKEKLLNKALLPLIGFSAGGLIGGAFLHLLPEAFEHQEKNIVFFHAILGFLAFFLLEKYLYWRHCHKGKCDLHMFTYLNLIGDGVHNFIDGLIIGASFTVDIRFGLLTALVIIFHEIPQELGDFGVLIYGGFSKRKALFYNFLSGLTCVAGTIIGFYFSRHTADFSAFLLPITAGGFIYIASCDLIPELYKQPDAKKSIAAMLFFLAGILIIFILKLSHTH